MRSNTSVKDLVKSLRDLDVLFYLGMYIEGDPQLCDCLFPTDEDYLEIDERTDDDTLIKVFTKFFNGSEIQVDGTILGHISHIKTMYMTVSRILHSDISEYGVDIDLGDELSDVFIPLLMSHFKKLFEDYL